MLNQSSDVRHVVAWLPAVRWATCLAVWIVLAVAWLMPALDFPLRATMPFGLTAAICRTLAAAMAHFRRAVPGWLSGCVLAADTALLTGLLDITGGPFNPFIVMYVVYIWLGAVALSPGWGAVAGVISVAGFAWLIVDHVQAGQLKHHRLNDLPTHLFTTWFAGAAVAELVAQYVMRARAVLAQRQQLFEEARERAVRSERLAALTTLAAGAAHELSTPLGTIAVAARELERSSARLCEASSIVNAIKDDARLIRTEIDRCNVILNGMSGRASDGTPTAPEPLSAEAIVQLAQSRLTEEQQQRLRIEIAPGVGTPGTAAAEIVQALSSLLKNAFDASGASHEVVLRVTQRGPMLRLEVRDRGVGMPDDVRRRVGEPFFTTKEPSKGRGLGLFLARTIAERSGGSLQLEGEQGTTAILEIPTTAAEAVQA